MRQICAKMVPKNIRKQYLNAQLCAVFDIQIHCGDVQPPYSPDAHLATSFYFTNKIGVETTGF
jgi:hypothetical protein